MATAEPAKFTVTPVMLAGCTVGSVTAAPSIRPSVSASSACSDSAPPFDTDDAMTSVFSGVIVCVRLPVPASIGAYCSFSAQNAKRMLSSTFRPQSACGFCCEWMCLYATRLGNAVLNAVSAEPVRFEAKCTRLAATDDRATSRPSIRLTLSAARSW